MEERLTGPGLRAARAATTRVSQGALAKHLGLAPQTVVDVELGRLDITTDEGLRWLEAIETLAHAPASDD